MGIAETQNLLNSEATRYSCRKEWFKTDWTNYALPAGVGVIPIIPIALSPFGFEMCSKDGLGMGLFLTNIFGGIAIGMNGLFFARALYQKCTIKHYRFGILTSKESKIDLIKELRFQGDLGMGVFGALIAINSIYLLALNLYCEHQ